MHNLVEAVDNVFRLWRALIGKNTEIPVSYTAPYFIDERSLTKTAGLIQIKDYAVANGVETLIDSLNTVQAHLRILKDEFFDLLMAKTGIDYFGKSEARPGLNIPEKTKFEKVLCKRLALAGTFVQDLHADPNFGRTKLAKLIYLADMRAGLNLEADYVREAAGPLDQRVLYNEQIGIESLAKKHQLFNTDIRSRMVRYLPLSGIVGIEELGSKHLGEKMLEIKRISKAAKPLDTEQSEIVATLFACWNDFLIRRRSPTDDEIVSEFLHHWHPKKSRFSRARLIKALGWMRKNDLVPTGTGKATRSKNKP